MAISSVTDVLSNHKKLAVAYESILSIVSNPPKAKKRLLRPLINYFVKAHMRSQYERLAGIYAREALLNSSSKDKAWEELRAVSIDTKNYYESLPSLKGFYAYIGGIISAIIGLLRFGIPNVDFGLYSLEISGIIPALLVSLALAAITLFVILLSFSTKRRLFLDPNHAKEYWNDNVSKRRGDKYNDSLYRIEDALYNSIGTTHSKKTEFPVDIFVIIAFGSLASVSFLLVSTNFFMDKSYETFVLQYGNFSFMLGIIMFMFIGAPWKEYKKRKSLRLL